jgi:hypothetical protein
MSRQNHGKEKMCHVPPKSHNCLIDPNCASVTSVTLTHHWCLSPPFPPPPQHWSCPWPWGCHSAPAPLQMQEKEEANLMGFNMVQPSTTHFFQVGLYNNAWPSIISLYITMHQVIMAVVLIEGQPRPLTSPQCLALQICAHRHAQALCWQLL